LETPLTSPWAVIGGTVSLGDADRELRRAWRTLDEEWRRGRHEGMLRLREVNLVVVCTEATVEQSRVTASFVGRSHPARVIVIVVDPEEQARSDSGIAAGPEAASFVARPRRPGSRRTHAFPSGPSASISTACLLDEISGHQVCSEEVLVRRAGREEEALRAAVTQILVPDVPVVGWWTQDPAADSVGLCWLAGIADQVVTDLGRSNEPVLGLGALADLVAEGSVMVRELEWSRSAPWRVLTAELFDQADKQALIPRMIWLEVDHREAPVQALLYASWFVSRLGLVIHDSGWWVENGSLCARFVDEEAADEARETGDDSDERGAKVPAELVVRLCSEVESDTEEIGLTGVRIGSRNEDSTEEASERALHLDRHPNSCLCSVTAGPEGAQLTVKSLLRTELDDDEGLSRVIDTPFVDKVLSETLLYARKLVGLPGFRFDLV